MWSKKFFQKHKPAIHKTLFLLDVKLLLEIADDVNTSQKILEQLSGHKNWEVRRNVASNQATPLHVLEKLYEDIDPIYRAVISNPSVPKTKISEYIHFIRNNQCVNSFATVVNLTEEDYLNLWNFSKRFYQKDAEHIKNWLVKNRSVTDTVLRKIFEEHKKDTNIMQSIAQHHNCSLELLEDIFNIGQQHKLFPNFYTSVASNHNATSEMLTTIFHKNSMYANHKIVQHPHTTFEVLQKLAEQNDVKTREIAAYRVWQMDTHLKNWPKEWVEERFAVTFNEKLLNTMPQQR